MNLSKIVLYGFEQVVYTIYILIIVSILLLVYGLRKKEKRIVHFNDIDILLAVYFIVCLCSILFIRKLQTDPAELLKYSAIILTYILTRNLRARSLFYHTVFLWGGIQSFVSFGQYYGIIAGRHEFFPVTGTFDNPGPLGGYLGISLITGVLLLISSIRQRQSLRVALYTSGSIITGTALLLTSSRAAFLSVGVALFYFLYKEFLTTVKPVCRTILVLVILCGGIIAAQLVYDMQPASVKARLLIWRVSATMFAEKTIAGHGAGGFRDAYMLYQAKYFENNPGSSFILVADNPLYPYNEIIHIAIEQGITGLLPVAALLFTLFFGKHTRSPENSMPKTILLAWLTFSLFSYPSGTFSLWILLPVLIAFINSTYVFPIRIHTGARLVCIGILLGLSAVTIHFHIRAHHLSAALISGSHSDDLSLFIDNHHIRTVLPVYARTHDTSLYKRIEESSGSYDTCMFLGDWYREKGNYEKSRYYYTLASHMIPNRMRPNYYLWQLAVKTNDMQQAVCYANKIINQPVKVSNTFTIRTKVQMGRFLKESGSY